MRRAALVCALAASTLSIGAARAAEMPSTKPVTTIEARNDPKSTKLAELNELTKLLVPERAVTQQQATRLVLIVNDKNIVEPRPVQLGRRVGNEVTIRAGLKGGERVVVDGLFKSRPGTEVKPVPAKAGPVMPPGAPAGPGAAPGAAAKVPAGEAKAPAKPADAPKK